MGRVRLQVVIAFVAIILLIVVMAYVAFSVTTVTVPDRGGTYVEGLAGNPQAINPILSQTNPVDQDLGALIFSGLTRVDDHGQMTPDLAVNWEISPDGTVYTFHLRPGVTWHDGAPFTSADVAFTVRAIQSPDFQGAAFPSDMWRTVTVEATDVLTVRFVLREPFAPFMDYTTLGILPEHVLGSAPAASLGESQFNASPIGTGPLRVAEVSAQHIVLVPYAEYYGALPYIDRFEFYYFPSNGTVFEARRRGEVSGIARVLPENLQSVRDDQELTLYSAPLSGYNLILLNLDRVMFQDRGVRQGMMWALDRQALIDSILDGQGMVIDSPILPNSWAYQSEVATYRHDAKKAVAALEAAGWYDDDHDGVRERGDQRLEFVLATNEDDPTRIALIEAVAQQLAEVGIRAIPQTVPWEQLVAEQLRLRRYDAVLTGWQNLPPDPDPYPYWHSSQANEGGLNLSNYISERADDLLAEARSTADQGRRLKLYFDFQDLFAEDVPALLLYQPIYNYAVDAQVHNVQIGPMWDASCRFQTLSRWYIATQRMLYSEARDQGLIER
jgi:peptide/nickel transport system substrate-binding protein